MLKWSMRVLVIFLLCLNSDSVGAVFQPSACAGSALCADVLPAQTPRIDPQPEHDSRELQLQDMLVLRLLPYMDDKLAAEYKNELTVNPQLYPYYVDVVKTERANGFRGFDLRITLQAVPTVGPHLPVGEDRFTFQISPAAGVKLLQFEHLKGPKKEDFPPNYQDLVR